MTAHNAPDAETFTQILRLLHIPDPVIPVQTYEATADQHALRTACLAAAAYGAAAGEAALAEIRMLSSGADLDEVTASRAAVLPATGTPDQLPAIWYWQVSQLAGQLRVLRNNADSDHRFINAASDTARALMLLLQAELDRGSQPAAAAHALIEAGETLARARAQITNPGGQPS
ncbi:hypothetical protein ACFY2K_30510 [Kitasatospora sp. NPDC001309]|uniref:hypothetical protein n=1 Tax=Kitasatospora sp. NPDC001309 TaxID=3364013 RepID=UPI0036A2549F